MVTFIAFLASGGVAFCILYGLFCAVVVFFPPSSDSGEAIIRFAKSDIRQHTQRISGTLETFFAKIVGARWGDFNTSLRLVAIYWLVLPSFVVTFMLDSKDVVQNSLWLPVALHVWVWANIVTDYVSFNVTRECLRAYREAPDPTPWLFVKLVLKDASIALAMVFLAIIGTNVAFVILKYQDVASMFAHAWETIFNARTIFHQFGIVSGGTTSAQFPAQFWIAVTSNIPTILCVVGMTAITGLMVLVNVLHWAIGFSAQRAWRTACFVGLLGSVTGTVTCAYFYHQVTQE